MLYVAAGYKAAGAEANASRLIRNDKASARIAELKGKAAEGAVATTREVLEQLTKIGFANMQDYMRIGPNGDPVLDFANLTREQAEAEARSWIIPRPVEEAEPIAQAS